MHLGGGAEDVVEAVEESPRVDHADDVDLQGDSGVRGSCG
jgi:hypothetical protein